MAEKKNVILNEEINSSYNFKEDDFVFVHEDKNIKIHDEALKTKPTTFAKDAFKRFCKNKSSVVGAIIIGILLFGSFVVPLVSPHNIKKVNPAVALLDSKLFDAGTGFWDGTVEYKNQLWDGTFENPEGSYPDEEHAIGKPAGDFVSRAVVWKTVKVTDVQYSNIVTKYATGGYAFLVHDNKSGTAGKNGFYQNYNPFEFKSDYNYTLKLSFKDFDGSGATDLPYENLETTETQIRLIYGSSKSEVDSGSHSIVLSDWEKRDGEFEFNLSESLLAEGISEAKCRIRIEGKPANERNYTYFALQHAIISAESKVEGEEVPEEIASELEDISILNANFTLCNDYADGQGLNPAKSIHYWQSNCTRTIYHAEIQKVNFRYDPYEAVLGVRENFIVGGSLFETYKKKGWCTFDKFENLQDTFEILDPKRCPVEKVNGAGSYNEQYDAWQFECHVTYYKYIGYTSMPKYLFGTDSNGFDIFTKALNCLKTSLLVAIISSAVCLFIGLIWGSISGYFGGTVDIVMERITDIISGIPWIVMMTLIILLLGNNVVTFAIALIMTGWIGTASRTRTQFYRFKGREYVLASRTLGASDGRLIFRHILPNGLGTIVTGSVLMIPGCIFSESSIAYLGLGLKGVDSFGVLLANNQQYLNSHPALIIFPTIIISLLMISFNLFGNGLRDALNPALKGED